MKIESTILRRLGPVPFWRGEQKCLEALDTLYRKAADRAKATLCNKSTSTSKGRSPGRLA